jgi:murein DD-endopeptidase MepM/ murein hydrolase activator NlpD
MITILWPCVGFWITDDWPDHIARPGYNRAYAGTDLARSECPLRGSQYGGKVLQAMWSTQGYGYTTFVEFSNDAGEAVLRIRNAHQKNVAVAVGDAVTPITNLGTLDSTGNSTGNHTHFEVWMKINGQWQNIDPQDIKYDIQMVYDPAQLIPLSGEIIVPEPEYVIPTIPVLPKIRTTAVITAWVNLRDTPYKNSKDIGDVKPGEIWQVSDSYTDVLGNIWLLLSKGHKHGWAAAYYNGEIWFEEVVA